MNVFDIFESGKGPRRNNATTDPTWSAFKPLVETQMNDVEEATTYSTRPDRPAPNTDISVGDRVVADLRKDKKYPGTQQYCSGIAVRVGEKGVTIAPDRGGEPEWHPYKIVKKLRAKEVAEEQEQDHGYRPTSLNLDDYRDSYDPRTVEPYADNAKFKDNNDLRDMVEDLIERGVKPERETVSPRQLIATQDWLSDHGSDDGPLYDKYQDRPVVLRYNNKDYVIDGHHRCAAALQAGKTIRVWMFTAPQGMAEGSLNEFAPSPGYPGGGGGASNSFSLYLDGDLVDTFGTSGEAIQYAKDMMEDDYRVQNSSWELTDVMGNTIWNQDGGQSMEESAAWKRKAGKSKTGGLNAKGVASYRRENPGSKLQTAVTTKPSKLKPGSKDAKRRKSFCARMSGNKGPMKDEHGKPTRKALALRKWNCNESMAEGQNDLHKYHQELRKKSGLPDPEVYKQMIKAKQAEIDALRAEIAADNAKKTEDSNMPVAVDSTSPIHGMGEHIVKVKGGYELKSRHGDKNLGKYPTRAGAEKRERQVQYFKHAGESVEEETDAFTSAGLNGVSASQGSDNTFSPIGSGAKMETVDGGWMGEDEQQFNIGDDVVITGDVQYQGSTGIIDSIGRNGSFVVVNLYNHGKTSFHSSDVSINQYADSDDEEADMYDEIDEDKHDWDIGDEVEITGDVQYNGDTGVIDSFSPSGSFVVVNLYNHGKKSFHKSDISFNDYAGSDEEEARMYDAGEFRTDIDEEDAWSDGVGAWHDPQSTPQDAWSDGIGAWHGGGETAMSEDTDINIDNYLAEMKAAGYFDK